MAAKDAFLVDLGGTQKALLLRHKAPMTAILTTLGWADAPDPIPDETNLVAEGIEESMEKGCFPIRITYKVSTRKKAQTICLCSPTKADTALDALVGKTYNGKKIVKATPVRRIKYVY